MRWPQPGPQAKFVRFEPPSVDVRLRLKDTTAQRTFQSVPVSFSATYEVLSRYIPVPVDPAEFRPDIVVAGPKQLIDNLRKEDSAGCRGGPPTRPTSPAITRQIGPEPSGQPPDPHATVDVRFTLQEKTATAG
jgi:hypothetical protein